MTELLKLGFKGTTKIYIGENRHKDTPILMPKTDLTEHQKFKLIGLIADSYYNTDIDTDEFACEFYGIVNMILNRGYIPLELEYLAMEELYEQILDILGEK